MDRIASVVIIAGCLAGVISGPAFAQPPEQAEDSRYIFNRVEDGFLRLDIRTGQVSLCSRKPVGWACEVVPDERAALENEIGRLQTENGALKKELVARGLALPGGKAETPPSAAKPKDGELRLPSDAEMDRVFSFLEKMWRRFLDVIAQWQKDMLRKT
jgi:hypothetical protein